MRFVFDSWFIHSVQCHLGHKITSCFCDDSEITWRCLLAMVSLWVWLTCCLWNNFATFLMSEEIAQCQTPSTKDLFHWDKYDRILTYGYIWSRFLHHWLCHYGKFPPPLQHPLILLMCVHHQYPTTYPREQTSFVQLIGAKGTNNHNLWNHMPFNSADIPRKLHL